MVRRCAVLIACSAAFLLAATGGAQARVIHVNGHNYGVTYKPGAQPTSNEVPGVGFANDGPAQPPLTYGGGPVMLNSALYLIFWGPSGSFASTYENPIIQWAKDLATASSTNVDEFSVLRQYTDGSGHNITGTVSYGGSLNDTQAYPGKAAPCTSASTPCITDSQLQTEIKRVIAAQKWPEDAPAAPAAQYIVLLPSGTDACIDNVFSDCADESNGYCAYHAESNLADGNVAVYSEIPYVPLCDSGQHPSGVDSNADTDGSLDSAIHEVAEAATDPDGQTGYLDSGFNEIGDKCDGQSVSLTTAQIYGQPLGGSLSADTAFNQLIGGHSYYTQQLWSNAPTKTPSKTTAAGCAQRIGPSPWFAPPTGVTTGTAATFDGTRSYDIWSALTSYSWSFGDGSLAQSGSKPTHIFDKAGTYTVKLTVGDATGTSSRSTESAPVTVTGPTLVPSISGFSAASGKTGATITINGSNLASASSVHFNGKAAKIVSDTATAVQAVVPNGASTGPVTVTTAGGTGTSPSNFTVTFSVTGFTPSSGAAGTSVTINGVGFTSTSTVKFHGTAAASVAFVSSTQLTAVVPSGATTGAITVTNTAAPAGTVSSALSYTV